MDELANRRVAPTPSVPPKVKGTRPPNEIDFWRGFALIAIFINHVPGIFYEKFTHRNFGFSDSAELFVLLAGWSLHRSLQLGAVCGSLSTRAAGGTAAQATLAEAIPYLTEVDHA